LKYSSVFVLSSWFQCPLQSSFIYTYTMCDLVYGRMLQCVLVYGRMLQWVLVYGRMLHGVLIYGRMLQCVLIYGRILQWFVRICTLFMVSMPSTVKLYIYIYHWNYYRNSLKPVFSSCC
jgi:hypothetical protein